MRYSAAMSHSSIVAERPRFRRTGIPVLPTSLRSSKFCMFLAPIWNMSMYDFIISTSLGETTSVVTGMPYLSPASLRYLRPSSPSPWKEYGLVRGLKAPPRRMTAPASLTEAAISMIWERHSHAHGPAIMATLLPPILTFPTFTIVSSFLSSRDASLYGLEMGTTDATPGRISTSRGSTWAIPTAPSTVSCSPFISLTMKPLSVRKDLTFSFSWAVMPCLRITIIA